jgi:2-dehydropantoate 2-reductase
MTKKIVVYGAGAIGGQVGARLSAAQDDVTLVDPWEPQVETVQRQGMVVHDADGEHHYDPRIIRPAELERLGGSVDILFMCVKSYDTASALENILPYLAPDALVVSLQNSINEEIIAPVVGAERTYGGAILINAVLLDPGHVTWSTSISQSGGGPSPGVIMGEYLRPAGPKTEELRGIMDAVWPAVTSDNLMLERWTKLITNCMVNVTAGISGLRSAALLANPLARDIIVGLAAEALHVAHADGYDVEHVMGVYSPEQVHACAVGASTEVQDDLAVRATRIKSEAATSLLQDVLRGRLTEVEYFNGLIARKGSENGVTTPLSTAVTDLMHQVERGEVASAPESMDSLRPLLITPTVPG